MYANNYDQAGRTIPLGPEVIERKVPPIGVALEQLEKELHYLREGIKHLEQRLSVAMRPMPVSDTGAPINRGGGSPIVGQIETYTQLARSASADIHAILDCLEI